MTVIPLKPELLSEHLDEAIRFDESKMDSALIALLEATRDDEPGAGMTAEEFSVWMRSL